MWPPSNNINLMDIWQILCYLNAFFCLIEYCIVIYLTRSASWEETIGHLSKVQIKGNMTDKVKTKSIQQGTERHIRPHALNPITFLLFLGAQAKVGTSKSFIIQKEGRRKWGIAVCDF